MSFIVLYAKVQINDDGIIMQGTFFGGVSQSKKDAEIIARDCVNTIKGNTILYYIAELDKNEQLVDKCYEAIDKFDRTHRQMIEANSIIKRNVTLK